MRTGSILVLALLFLAGLRASAASDPGVEFTGIVVSDGVTRLALTEKATSLTQWVEKGGEFKGVTVVNYEPKQETIVVRKAGEEFRLPLVSVKSPITVASAPAAAPALSALPSTPAPEPATVPAATVVPSAPATPPTPEAAPTNYYTVKTGDTLATVAANTGVAVEQLAALNPSLSPTALKPGDSIRTK